MLSIDSHFCFHFCALIERKIFTDCSLFLSFTGLERWFGQDTCQTRYRVSEERKREFKGNEFRCVDQIVESKSFTSRNDWNNKILLCDREQQPTIAPQAAPSTDWKLISRQVWRCSESHWPNNLSSWPSWSLSYSAFPWVTFSSHVATERRHMYTCTYIYTHTLTSFIFVSFSFVYF